eukprot:TRINITY_DN10947_c0_g1_i1.p1 TRINITY_DN10947_c0_g1~~TRINITY_DN10947_c0_g1_i1.p1  ORF type:complete len:505 (-),score=61.99 TRINITY_DN10947_c0_g1_i1:50-1564(-)
MDGMRMKNSGDKLLSKERYGGTSSPKTRMYTMDSSTTTEESFSHNHSHGQDEDVLATIGSYYLSNQPLLSDPYESNRLITVLSYLLFMMLGICAQLLENAIFLETARLNNSEGKNLSAFIVTAYMCGNIAVLLYLFLKHKFGNRFKELYVVWVIFLVTLVCAILAAFFHNTQVEVLGHNVSIPLFIISVFAGAAGNTSTLVFFAFASQYKPLLTTALNVGYSTSAFIAAALSLIQVPVPHFGPTIYFLVISALTFLGLISYFFITKFFSSLKTLSIDLHTYHERYLNLLINNDNDVNLNGNHAANFMKNNNNTNASESPNYYDYTVVPVGGIKYILANMIYITILTFFMPGILSYAAADTDSSKNSDATNKNVWEILNVIFLVGPPLGAGFAGFYQMKFRIILLNAICTVLFLGMVVPVVFNAMGIHSFANWETTWILVSMLTIFSFLSGYVTTLLYLMVRLGEFVENTEKYSRWVATANQVGGTIGVVINDIALIIYFLVHKR